MTSISKSPKRGETIRAVNLTETKKRDIMKWENQQSINRRKKTQLRKKNHDRKQIESRKKKKGIAINREGGNSEIGLKKEE